MQRYPKLMARDALHAAVYRAYDAQAFYSYDADFDVIEFINRCETDLSPTGKHCA